MADTLFLIRITHTIGDMGSLARLLPKDASGTGGSVSYWAEIQRQVQGLSLDWPRVVVYQDGLPNANADILQKILNEVHSPNWDLLRWLVSQGARLIGTESPELIKEEYDLLEGVLTAKNHEEKAAAHRKYAERAGVLLSERDAYIAHRIAETLPTDGVGLLFVGQAHNVVEHLGTEIVVREIPHRGKAI